MTNQTNADIFAVQNIQAHTNIFVKVAYSGDSQLFYIGGPVKIKQMFTDRHQKIIKDITNTGVVIISFVI